jgi:DNA-binding MarR family transcriptional regulator
MLTSDHLDGERLARGDVDQFDEAERQGDQVKGPQRQVARERQGSQRISIVLHRASRLLSQVYREALADSGVSLPDYRVLRALVYSGEPYVLHPAEIARACGQTKSTMTRRLDLLEDRRLIRRVCDPGHRARILIQLTTAGHDAWQDAHLYITRAEAQHLVCLDDHDKQELTRLLTALIG